MGFTNCKEFSVDGIGIGYTSKRIETANNIPLIIMGDFHIGDDGADMEAIKRMFKQAEDIGARVILTGDIMNMALVNSVSFTYGSDPNIDLTLAGRIFQDYAHIIDGVVCGNHDARLIKATGIDALEYICKFLNIPYHPDAIVINYKIGLGTRPQSYTVFVMHGNSGGRTPGAKINGVRRMAEVVTNANVYASGHTHALQSHKENSVVIDHIHEKLRMEERVFVNAGSFLRYVGYPVRMGLTPSSIGAPVVVLGAEDKFVNVTI